ncbi:MAG TPA: FlxA-like family protein [Candidatus Acidoferrales bacterium]|jgi:TolA-binding protein|nr:FlxA-like family protein [Candidatus Acidoferrales bacterium]
MRAFWLCIVALGLAVSPAMAGTGAGGDKDSAGNGAANTAAKADPAPAASSPSSLEIENELQQMRDLLEAQSKQLQQQDEQIKEQKQQMQTLQDQLTVAKPNSDSSTSWVAAPVNAPVGTAGIIGNGSASNSGGDAQSGEPNSINFKGVTLTPGGFMVAETAWRQHALNADVNTPFNSIPYGASDNAGVSEFNASGRQSRISMLVQGKTDWGTIGGYYETDFLSGAVTSNYNQSNSFALRQRQFFAQVALNSGWTFTGGQMWSLVTETQKGMDNRTEATPGTIDAQYNVGFSWARQYGFRVTKNFNNKIWLGFSVENAQDTPVSNHGASTNYLVGAPGTNGGLLPSTNNFTYNAAPDFVFKAAFEPKNNMHFEVFGLVSTFRSRVYPCATTPTGDTCSVDTTGFGITGPSGVGAFNDKRVGGGAGANARVGLFNKKVVLGLHFLGGDGVGRYGTSQLVDVVVRPDGTLAPVRSFQGLGTIELNPTPKWNIYMYAGDEYAQRTSYGSTIGYGAPGLANFGCSVPVEPLPGSGGFSPTSAPSCTGDTRNIIEGTFGFWYRFYKGPKGTVQWGPQYSYVTRSAWSGNGTGTLLGVPISTSGKPTAIENMVLTSFRYYLP